MEGERGREEGERRKGGERGGEGGERKGRGEGGREVEDGMSWQKVLYKYSSVTEVVPQAN